MNPNDRMHPQDVRNLIIFAIFSISLWLAYDHFIARPQAEAVRAHVAQAKIAAANAPPEVASTALNLPREEVIAETPRIPIETPTLEGSINLKGARIDDLLLKNYHKTVERKEQVEMLSPARTKFPRYIETGWISSDKDLPLPDAETLWRVSGDNDVLKSGHPVTLNADVAGIRYTIVIEIDENYGFSIESRAVNTRSEKVTVYPFALVTEHGKPEDFQNLGIIHEGPIAYLDSSLEERTYDDLQKSQLDEFSAKNGWIGLTGKYWLTAIAPENKDEDKRFRFVASPAISEETKTRYQSDLTGAARELDPGEEARASLHIFSGPKRLALLEDYEEQWDIPRFDLAVDFGWFYFLTKPFFMALNFLYGLTGNFGVAIIVFTCILRLFIFPLANTSYKSFAKLRVISPEMYNIRHQYKDDKKKLQEELVKLYQKHDVNPMAGCLPILIQIPIFFSLYKVLSNTIEMRHAPFFGWIEDLSAKDPTSLFNLFGLLPYDVPSFLMIGAWPVLMFVGMIIQRNISPPPDDPIMARMIQIMPYFMTYIMAGFASGLVIYWTFSNLLGIIQQIVIMRSMGVPIHLFNRDKTQKDLEKEVVEGPAVHPSLEIAEQKLEDAVLGEDADRAVTKGLPPVTPPKPKKKKKK